MIAAEARVIAQPHDPQRLSDRAFARRQHRAGHQDQNVAPDRGGETRSEYRQPRDQHRWNQGRSGHRDGARAIRCHRSLGIHRSPRRKSLPIRDFRDPGGLSSRHDRSDHSAYRGVPLLARTAIRRAAQPRLHVISRRIRSAGRTISAGWTGRSCRSSLLVALEAAMDQRWPSRTCGSIARSRPRIHRR